MTGEEVPVSVRRLIVEADTASLNVSEFCRQHAVSTWFFYDLRKRHARDGDVVLEPLSRAPHRVPNRTGDDVVDVIVALRKELADDGLDCGAGSIWDRLPERLAPDQRRPSESTIWRRLRERGFIDPEPNKAPKRTVRSFTAARANECWQIDSTHWSLADGTAVEIIDIIDDCTRVVPRSVVVATTTTGNAWDALCDGADQWGWPERILSDNASVFRSLGPSLAAIGVGLGHSRPYNPQCCGKCERFHQTLKKHLAVLDPVPTTIGQLQAAVDRFIRRYNHDRPHRSIGRRPPAVVWAATAKSGPADRPLDTPTRIYHGQVTANGLIRAGRWTISLGTSHRHRTATTIITGTRAHVFIDGRVARALTLDPTASFQPIHDRPGRPRLP